MVILLIIRQEIKTDYREVENLVRESFWNIYRPGCYEHYIIHNTNLQVEICELSSTNETNKNAIDN